MSKSTCACTYTHKPVIMYLQMLRTEKHSSIFWVAVFEQMEQLCVSCCIIAQCRDEQRSVEIAKAMHGNRVSIDFLLFHDRNDIRTDLPVTAFPRPNRTRHVCFLVQRGKEYTDNITKYTGEHDCLEVFFCSGEVDDQSCDIVLLAMGRNGLFEGGRGLTSL